MLQLLLVAGRLLFLALVYYFLYRVIQNSARWVEVPESAHHVELAVESIPEGLMVRLPGQGGVVAAGEAIVVQPPVRLGRERSNDVVFEDPFVSGYHAEIDRYRGRWRLRDLRSKNGTWCNGARVAQPVFLAEGDRIKIGDSLLVWKG